MNYYKFGNLKVIINGADNYFKKMSAAYEVLPFESYDIKVNISKVSSIKAPLCKNIGEMPCALADLSWYGDGERIYMCGYNGPTDEYVFCASMDKTYKDISVDVLDIKAEVDASLYIKNVLDLVMRYAVINHNCINIHSSSIAYNNMGVLFSAPSGTGKSTHTSLWQKCYPETVIINDDLPLISVGEEILISGTPWAGTSDVNTNITVPLKAIAFLRRGEENSIERLNAAMSMRFLIDEIFKTPVSEITSKQFDMIGEILKKTPAYLLKCNISDDAVEVVKNVL